MGHPAGPRTLNVGDGTDALIPDGLDATLVLVRHGESEFIVEGRFQGQAETPLSPTGLRQAALVAERLAHPHDAPALPAAGGSAARARPLAAAADDPDRRGRRQRDAPGPGRPARSRASSRSGRASGRASTATRSAPAMRTRWRPGGGRRPKAWAPGGESLAQVAARVRPALAAVLARARRRRHARAAWIAARSPATATRRRPTCPGRSSSPTTGSSRSAC